MTRGDYVPLEKGNLSITSKRQRSESISGKRKRGSLCLYLVASVAAITLLIFISGPAAQYNRLVGQSADQFSCGQARCRFLLVTAVSEGESKAIVHLSQTARLAKELNRTLVLSNVHLGRLHVCSSTPWSAYSDLEWYQRQFGIRAITFSQYQSWVSAQSHQPTAAYLLASAQRTTDGTIARGDAISKKLLKSTCDAKAPLDYSFFPDIIKMTSPEVYDPAHTPADFGERLVGSLPAFLRAVNANGKTIEPDIVSMEWHFALPLWPFPGTDSLLVGAFPVRYSARLRASSDDLAKGMSPYIAVHWRMETADPQYFIECAKSLHSMISNLTEQHTDVHNVFLLTDYPIEDESQQHSHTFTEITDVHREAVRYFVDNFSTATNGATLRTLAGILPKMRDFTTDQELPLHDIDPGLSGMLDRSLASKGQMLLAGSPRVCARHSSMTAQIVEDRRRRLAEDDGSLWNDVDYFVHPQRKSTIMY